MQALLRRPAALSDAEGAAEVKDLAKLTAIVWEALRLNPAIQPGQWRIAAGDCRIGGTSAKRRSEGNTLLVCTASAMRDGQAYRRPCRFDPDRNRRGAFIFGEGDHDCVGAHLALPIITNVLAALLARRGLRAARSPGPPAAGWPPLSLTMSFDDPSAPLVQTMITILAPVRDGVGWGDLDARLRALGGNPAAEGSPLGQALKKSGIVHFASFSCLDIGDPGEPSLRLLLELNVDGEADVALATIVDHAGAVLEPIFHGAVDATEPLARLLKRYRLRPEPWRICGSGLQFNGTPEFPVADIERQERLAAFCRQALEPYLRRHVGLGGRAWDALADVRRQLQRDPELADFLIRPGARKLEFPQPVSTEPWTALQSLSDFFLVSSGGIWTSLLILALLAILTTINYSALAVLDWSNQAVKHTIDGRLLIAFTTGLVGEAIILSLIVGGFVWLLRRAEKSDTADDAMPAFSALQAAAAVENAPGYAQNHFIAVNRLKPGLLRRITLIGALMSVANLVLTRFRKGFVLNMNTIHYAQWFKVPGSDKLIFLASFDGSWESYLEDFIMRVHAGQSAVWSNCVGFPTTRYLIMDGAADGDRFKRFTRCKQRLAPFWYSRFPHLTTRAMRENALIHYGLMRVTNEAGARAWLRCFGSMQRPETAIETDEAQALVFTGMGDLPYAACLLIRLPDDPADCRRWLAGLLPGRAGVANPATLTFGERLDGRGAAAICLAFTADGLAKFGLPPREAADGLGVFPAPFTMGMAARARVLGDFGQADPNTWRWSDAPTGDSDGGIDAALLVYGRAPADRDKLRKFHEARVRTYKGILVDAIDTQPTECYANEEYRREHFGFRDGISQPIMRGTQRFALDPLARDIVEPGEFLLGYNGNQGWIAPSLIVRPKSDPDNNLPVENADRKIDPLDVGEVFPDFDEADRTYARRDFGRNGASWPSANSPRTSTPSRITPNGKRQECGPTIPMPPASPEGRSTQSGSPPRWSGAGATERRCSIGRDSPPLRSRARRWRPGVRPGALLPREVLRAPAPRGGRPGADPTAGCMIRIMTSPMEPTIQSA